LANTVSDSSKFNSNLIFVSPKTKEKLYKIDLKTEKNNVYRINLNSIKHVSGSVYFTGIIFGGSTYGKTYLFKIDLNKKLVDSSLIENNSDIIFSEDGEMYISSISGKEKSTYSVFSLYNNSILNSFSATGKKLHSFQVDENDQVIVCYKKPSNSLMERFVYGRNGELKSRIIGFLSNCNTGYVYANSKYYKINK